jgi:uncharacterized protein (TIGR00369 family)
VSDHRYVGKFHIPMQDYMGITIERATPTAIVKMELSDNIRGGAAPVHGGALCTLADIACGVALGDDWDFTKEFPVSVDLNVRFFAQPKSGPLTAEATAVHRGRKITGAECVITDGDGRQVARAAGTYMIVPGFGDTATGEARSYRSED